jgi:hypothetical protein
MVATLQYSLRQARVVVAAALVKVAMQRDHPGRDAPEVPVAVPQSQGQRVLPHLVKVLTAAQALTLPTLTVAVAVAAHLP